jgi:hypothetical protein
VRLQLGFRAVKLRDSFAACEVGADDPCAVGSCCLQLVVWRGACGLLGFLPFAVCICTLRGFACPQAVRHRHITGPQAGFACSGGGRFCTVEVLLQTFGHTNTQMPYSAGNLEHNTTAPRPEPCLQLHIG